MRVFGVFLSLNGLLFILCEREKFYYFLLSQKGNYHERNYFKRQLYRPCSAPRRTQTVIRSSLVCRRMSSKRLNYSQKCDIINSPINKNLSNYNGHIIETKGEVNMEKIINIENLRNFAYCNNQICKKTD